MLFRSNEEPGTVWMERVTRTFPHLIWLNPIPEKQWAYTESIGMLQNLVNKRMYPLTLSGLEAGMRELVR